MLAQIWNLGSALVLGNKNFMQQIVTSKKTPMGLF